MSDSTMRWFRVWRWHVISMLALSAVATLGAAQTPVGGDVNAKSDQAKSDQAKAVFAGGCFWCVEADFEKVPGVISVVSGYTGGSKRNPTYEEVAAKGTGHAEAVTVVFDPKRISYAQLVERFWRTIDPTVKDQQFCDVGSPYRTAIFALDAEQLKVAEASRAALEQSKPFKAPIVTEIVMAGPFYMAEEYHQDYYKKNPLRYKYYRAGCGRDQRLEQLWKEQKGY